MADGSPHPVFYPAPLSQRQLAPAIWARPEHLVGFDHEAYLRNAHVQANLRFHLKSHANRSSFRLNPVHEAVAWSLAIHEASHSEVDHVVAFAAHDGAVLQKYGATEVSRLFGVHLDEIRRAHTLERLLSIPSLDTVRMANALSGLHNGDLDEQGNRVAQFFGKRIVLVPCEIKSGGHMEFASDATVYAAQSSHVQFEGNGDIRIGISWLGARIPVASLDPLLILRLPGIWQDDNKATLHMAIEDGYLRVQLTKGSGSNLLGCEFERKGDGAKLRFFEPAAAKISVKAPMQTLSGNEKTMTHTGHSEAMGTHATGLIQFLPLFPVNNRRTRNEPSPVENPNGGVLRTIQMGATSQARLDKMKRETPYGVACGSLLVQGSEAAELPGMSFRAMPMALEYMALATLLEDILLRTKNTPASSAFCGQLREMIDRLVDMSYPEFANRWNQQKWIGVQAPAPRGLPLSNEFLACLLDHAQREPDQAVDALLTKAGHDPGLHLALGPLDVPMCMHDQMESIQAGVDAICTLVQMRSPLQAIKRLSEIRHQARIA